MKLSYLCFRFFFIAIVLILSFHAIILQATESNKYTQYNYQRYPSVNNSKGKAVIQSASEYSYPPFSIVNNGEADGFSVELLRSALQELNLDVSFKVGSWNELKEDLKQGRIQTLPLVGRTPEREKVYDFTAAYMTLHGAVFVRKGDDRIKTIDDLLDKKVVVMKGDNAEEYAQRDNISTSIISVDTYEIAMQLLSEGKYDAVVAQHLMGIQLLNDMGMSDNIIPALRLDRFRQEFSFAVRKGDKKLLKLLDEGLAIVKANGTYDRLYNKWFSTVLEGDKKEKFSQSNFVLKWLGSIFAIISTFLIILWFLQEKPKKFSIKGTLFLVSFIFIGLISSVGVLVVLLIEGEKHRTEIDEYKTSSLALAIELKQSSDDLTRFARTYVVTGNPKYESYFWAISAIRDGRQPHPANYTPAFWDHVAANVISLNQGGETYSIEQKIKDLGLTYEEEQMLVLAKQESDDLINLETVAMNAVKGRFKDPQGKFSILGKPDMKVARQIMHGQEYHEAKQRIMKPIDDFFSLLKARTANEINQIRERNNAIILVITLLTGTAICFAIYVFFLLKRTVISPLIILEDAVKRVGVGEKDLQIDIKAENEIGLLANAFNEMISRQLASETELELVNQRLALGIKAGSIGVWDWDISRNVTSWNDKLFEIYDLPKEIPMPYEKWASTVHPDDFHDAELWLQRIIDEKVTEFYEFRIYRPDKTVRYISAAGIAVTNSYGKVVRVIGTNIDITSRKKMELDILQAKEQAESANKAKSIFLANMSHEIRTPMNAILGYAQILKRDHTLTNKQREYINVMDTSGKYLLALINDILEMSKIEAGRVEIVKKPFNLRAMYKDIIQMFNVRAMEKGVELRLEDNFEISGVIVQDEYKIRQIIINLLGNAVKFINSGYIILRFNCQKVDGGGVCDETDKYVILCLEVEDTGFGIALEEQEKVFEVFDQTESGREIEGGSGLGLPISRKYAQLMGGDLELVKSTPGKGSIFRATINAELGEEQDVLVEKPNKLVKKIKDGQPEQHILVVDDRVMNRDVLSLMLSKVGFHVHTANNGKEAVELYKKIRPNCVLMDIRMPIMDGVEATRQIKNLSGETKANVIAVSASALDEQRAKAIKYGADAFIKKPVEEYELFEVIRRLLGIQYDYEGGELDVEYQNNFIEFDKDSLRSLPNELRTELKKAAVIGNLHMLEDLIDKVTDIDKNIGKTFKDCLDNFDLTRLHQLIMEGEENEQ